MKRYIEIVYDNSGSMENRVGNKLKYEIAQELFEKEIPKWEKILGVNVKAYFVQKMKTKWGSWNHKSQNIRLNTELVKKPKDLVEYVIVH
jgi:predicted metal-dependent hydrolase